MAYSTSFYEVLIQFSPAAISHVFDYDGIFSIDIQSSDMSYLRGDRPEYTQLSPMIEKKEISQRPRMALSLNCVLTRTACPGKIIVI